MGQAYWSGQKAQKENAWSPEQQKAGSWLADYQPQQYGGPLSYQSTLLPAYQTRLDKWMEGLKPAENQWVSPDMSKYSGDPDLKKLLMEAYNRPAVDVSALYAPSRASAETGLRENIAKGGELLNFGRYGSPANEMIGRLSQEMEQNLAVQMAQARIGAEQQQRMLQYQSILPQLRQWAESQMGAGMAGQDALQRYYAGLSQQNLGQQQLGLQGISQYGDIAKVMAQIEQQNQMNQYQAWLQPQQMQLQAAQGLLGAQPYQWTQRGDPGYFGLINALAGGAAGALTGYGLSQL